jgi:hypothetical protein
VNRYLEEAGRRLEIFTGGRRPDADALTARLEGQRAKADEQFEEGFNRLMEYLCAHHPQEYATILQEHAERQREALEPGKPLSKPLAEYLQEQGITQESMERYRRERGPDPLAGADEFVTDCVRAYRSLYNPAAIQAEIDRLEDEHDRRTEAWADLPTPLAKSKARARLAALERSIDELRCHQDNLAKDVEQLWQVVYSLQMAVVEAQLAMRDDNDEADLRRRAEALRAVIDRIECTFIATGKRGGGWGMKNSILAGVTVYPLDGNSVQYRADREPAEGSLKPDKASSFW